MFAPFARAQNLRMLDQARVWEVLEYSFRECAGVLRRRMPVGTVLGVIGLCVVFVLLGADGFAAGDATLVASVASAIAILGALRYRPLRLAFAAAARRLERRNRAPGRSGFERARELVDARLDARFERRLFPHPAQPLLRAQDAGGRGEQRAERGVHGGVQRFGRYYPLHESPVERFPGVDGFAGQHQPACAPGADQPRK